MLFSICIPVYNTSKYLDECLQSVLCQTEKDYEIVLVDDGSTDDSGELCDRYAAQYPQIRVIHKENEGLMMTRRRGFQEAKGDFFICLDSDDALNDICALEKIRHLIVNKDADLVFYEYTSATELNTQQPDRCITLFDYPNEYVFEEEDKKSLYQKLLLGKDFNSIFIKVISRRVLDLNTDYSQWKNSLVNSQAEDLFQSMPILDAAKRVAYLKEPLYFYRWNPNSISRNIRPDYYYAYRTVYQRADEYLKKWEFTSEQIHQVMQRRINTILGVLLAQSHPDHEQWLAVLKDVADDSFFCNLWRRRDSKYICKYYLLMGDLILNKRFATLQIVKKMVETIVQTRKKILQR